MLPVYYIITPPGYAAIIENALGILGSKMLFETEEDAREAIKFMGLDNTAQHLVTRIAVHSQ